jgi:hypothetical protein
MPTKKKAAKKAAKKQVKKVAAKKAVKKTAKKPVVKKASKKTVAVKAVTDSTGVVTMKSVDDPGTASTGKVATLKPTVDKETGVLTMVPDEDDDE